MLVEDDPVFIRTLSERLQVEGHSTREFLNPEEALEDLRRAPGDQEAILLDLRLPKINGLQWLKKVRLEGLPGVNSRSHNYQSFKKMTTSK